MRSALFAIAALACATSAHAQTPPPVSEPPWPPPCATQEFTVDLRFGQATLSAEAQRALTAQLDRARPCNVHLALVASADAAQADAVRAAMTAQGFPAGSVQTMRAIGRIAGNRRDIDQVRVTIVYK